MNYLVVAAHPDDETLGAGATIRKLTENGHRVAVCIMAASAGARANLSDTLQADEEAALALLGVSRVYRADFPNIKMNTTPHLELVQFIEKAIADFSAEAIITHHPSDTNNDHAMTSQAAQAAADEYLAQIRTANADTERRCAEMVAQAQARCDAADEEIRQKWAAFEQDVQRYLQAHDELKNFLGR